MTPSRWSTVLRRVTTEGPYINERMSVLVLTVVVLAGVSAVAYADKSVAPVSLASLYFLPLALSALVHPLRISLALSIVCLVLHDLVGSVRDVGTEHLLKDAITLLGYVFVVAVVNQLGGHRRRLAELAERQRDVSRHVFLNLQDKNVIAEIDPATDKQVAEYPVGKCRGNHGMALDSEHRLAFLSCEENDLIVVLGKHSIQDYSRWGRCQDSCRQDC
jgi:K+-sensing histidine kinase KdpD